MQVLPPSYGLNSVVRHDLPAKIHFQRLTLAEKVSLDKQEERFQKPRLQRRGRSTYKHSECDASNYNRAMRKPVFCSNPLLPWCSLNTGQCSLTTPTYCLGASTKVALLPFLNQNGILCHFASDQSCGDKAVAGNVGQPGALVQPPYASLVYLNSAMSIETSCAILDFMPTPVSDRRF